MEKTGDWIYYTIFMEMMGSTAVNGNNKKGTAGIGNLSIEITVLIEIRNEKVVPCKFFINVLQ